MTLAALDIGTNTILLLIAERADDGTLTAVREEIRFSRLGQGVDRTGALDPSAVERALDALRGYRALIDEAGCERIGAVGTQALREASNASAFLAPARDILGVPVEVITGEREAELEYLAAARAFPHLAEEGLIVADVGGGSTEIIVGEARTVRSRRSLRIGSVRMAERHLASDPPTAAEVKAMTADIDAALAELHVPRGASLLAMSGTATTLAAVALELSVYDADAVEGYRLERSALEAQLERYLSLSVEQRKQIPGLEPERADVIPAGTAVLARLMRRVEATELIVSGRGVRWGLAEQLASG